MRLAEGALPDLLEVPTGFGKTEAVLLAWSWRRLGHPDPEVRRATPRRLAWCLPMRTLVEQTAGRASKLFEELAAAGLVEDLPVHKMLGGSVERGWDETPWKECVLVGTQDQLLSRALMRGYSMSRYRWPVEFAQLHSDCLWVLDEVQLMGPGLSTAAQLEGFRRQLGTFGPSRSVWMSATLDPGQLDTVDLRPHELARFALSDGDLAQPSLARLWHAPKPLRRATASADDLDAVAAEIAQAHDPSSRTVVVLNRVRRAQQLFESLKGRIDGELRLLHSRFRPAERERIQAEVLSKDWKGVLVATQVVEAGVDISARVLVTDLAPWSSLVQRFGRCNRRGEHAREAALVLWLDSGDVGDDSAAPYAAVDLGQARGRLESLEDVGPSSLAGVELEPSRPELPVLRRKDLFELFDTEPDLAGHDIDVSRFVRGPGSPDVPLVWRRLEDAPSPEEPAATPAEICTVPLGKQVSDLVRKARESLGAWVWDPLDGRWRPADPGRLVPGRVVLLPVSAGGYDPDRGWTANPKDRPLPIELANATPEEAEADDRWSRGTGRWVSLSEHSLDAEAAMEQVLAQLEAELPRALLLGAARRHDLGKSHPVFQRMLSASLAEGEEAPGDGPWAKSARGRSSRRPRLRDEVPNAAPVRHEVASALATVVQGEPDLVAYLVGAHHGRLRLRLRARPEEPEAPEGRAFAFGLWEGDVLPATDLGDGLVVPETRISLELARAGRGDHGASWLERSLTLLEEWGPFRLAFLEAMVRVADWKATREERERTTGGTEVEILA